ncbi:uncharacterized protein METZ01_LOCUS170305, partial [marine metagenome]
VEVVFASKEIAESLLKERDVYTLNLNEFELKAKLQTTNQVSVDDYLSHAGIQGLEWQDEHIKKIELSLNSIRLALEKYQLPLPNEVVFVATTGLEEAGAAYTRGRAIFLSLKKIESDGITRLIAHELVHIATRNNAVWRDKLYSKIGFYPCETPSFSEAFNYIRFSNPDAPLIEHCIEVIYQGEMQRVAPIIFTRSSEYQGGSFFKYIEVELLLLDKDNETDYLLYPEEKRLISFDECEGFFEKVGYNTGYLFHAEEILADNVADILVGRERFDSPEIIEKIIPILNLESFN